MSALATDPLVVRAAAAWEVARVDASVDRLDLLAAVVWPESRLLVQAPVVERRRRLTAGEISRVLELRAAGVTFAAIASQLGRSPGTCKDAARRYASHSTILESTEGTNDE